MKKIILIFSLLLNLNVFSQDKGIQFEHDLSIKQICAQAKAANKFIFVDCYTTWCGPCKKLSANVFPQEELGTYFNAKFINVKIDMEKEQGKSYSKAYNVLGFPTLLFLNADGDVLNMASGNATVERLLAMGANCIANPETISETKLKIEKGDRSTKTLTKYLGASYNYDKPREFSSLMDEYFLTLNEEEIFSEDTWILFVEYQKNIYSKGFQYFIDNRDKFEETFGSDDIEYVLGEVYYYYLNELEEGNKTYNDLRAIDSEMFDAFWARNSFSEALNLCLKKNKNEAAWRSFIEQMTEYAAMNNADIFSINNGCWYIWENFKTFDDLETVKKAVKWSYKTVEADPENHLYNDTYAHLCYEIGMTKEAVKYEEIALKYAIRDNAEVVKWYKEALEKYKEAL